MPRVQVREMVSDLSFDGSNDQVNLETSSPLKPALFTITIWVYPTAFKWMYFMSAGYYDTNHIALGYHTGYPGWWIAYNKTSTNWGTFVQDKWTHLAIAYDGASFQLYENGIWKKTQTVAFDLTSNTQDWAFGRETGPSSSSRFWQGMIDDVHFYNEVLNATEIRQRYFEDIYSDETGLLGHWKMDENSGGTIYDAGGNHSIDGTINGPTWSTSIFSKTRVAI